ncbi:MAG: hypothetical protein MJZ37_00200 [Bacilli bacterium]|nr:hypothetical protein [Bacilli bacterium]
MKATLNENETELVVSIINCLIERLPQDEYDFDTCAIGYCEDNKKLIIESNNGDELSDTLEWVLEEVVDTVCSFHSELEKANDKINVLMDYVDEDDLEEVKNVFKKIDNRDKE